MMTLIYTNDGLLGIKYGKDCSVIWCKDFLEVAKLGAAHYAKMDMTPISMYSEIMVAVEAMTYKCHTYADFGVFGTFVFSYEDSAA